MVAQHYGYMRKYRLIVRISWGESWLERVKNFKEALIALEAAAWGSVNYSLAALAASVKYITQSSLKLIALYCLSPSIILMTPISNNL